jgi:hypothetical protein
VKSEIIDPEHRQHGLKTRVTGDAWVAFGIGILTFLVFSGVLSHALLDAWDDNIAITENPDYNPPTLAKLVHYWVPPPRDEFFVPVMYTLWGLVAMGARSPAGVLNQAAFHALNLVGHSLASALAFLVLRRLNVRTWTAAGAALVFALHPIQTEAVAWASSAYTPISGMLGLLAVWQFLEYSDARDPGHRKAARGHYAAALVAFVIAMLTKPAAVSVPLITGAIEVGVRGKRLSKVVLPLGVWELVSVPIVIATRHGTPGATVGQFDRWQKLIVALDAVAFYLFKIVLPFKLSPDYGRSPGWVLVHPGIWAAALVPVALFVVVWVMRRRAAWLAGAGAVFILGLLPTLGLAPFNFQTFSTVADRYAYLAMFGVAIATGMALERVRAKRVAAVVVTVIILGLAALSVRQMTHWRNGWTLFDYTLKTNPQSRIVGAQMRFMLTPENEARCDLPSGEISRIADRLMGQKRSNLAAPVYRMALDRGDVNPSTWHGLALAYIESEEPARAVAVLDKALGRNPRDAEAHALKGVVLSRTDVEGAAVEYREALVIDPHNETVRRGILLLRPATRPGQ